MDALEPAQYLHIRRFKERMNTNRKRDSSHCSHITFIFALLFCLLVSQIVRISTAAAAVSRQDLKPAENIIKKEIRSGRIPGAVLIVGSPDRIILRKAYGYRSIKPSKQPMTVDTIFDLASLTKVIATTTAVIKLKDD